LNDDYASAIQKLNSFSNIKTIGYVKTNFAQRNIADVLHDVSVYAGWSKSNGGLAMHGIFFDEVAYEYDEGTRDYMQAINQAAKRADGLMGSRMVSDATGLGCA
jgi:hypothetical protein